MRPHVGAPAAAPSQVRPMPPLVAPAPPRDPAPQPQQPSALTPQDRALLLGAVAGQRAPAPGVDRAPSTRASAERMQDALRRAKAAACTAAMTTDAAPLVGVLTYGPQAACASSPPPSCSRAPPPPMPAPPAAAGSGAPPMTEACPLCALPAPVFAGAAGEDAGGTATVPVPGGPAAGAAVGEATAPPPESPAGGSAGMRALSNLEAGRGIALQQLPRIKTAPLPAPASGTLSAGGERQPAPSPVDAARGQHADAAAALRAEASAAPLLGSASPKAAAGAVLMDAWAAQRRGTDSPSTPSSPTRFHAGYV